MEESPAEMEDERNGSGERRTRRCCRSEKPPLPPSSKIEHIDKVAKIVAEEEDHKIEEILLKLLRITKNHERWGFLLADDPFHAYYCRRIAERRRTIKGLDL